MSLLRHNRVIATWLPPSTAGDDEEIRNRIAERAQFYFPEFGDAREVKVLRKAQRAYSKIYEVQIRHEKIGSRRVIVKAGINARREYDQLKNLWEEFSVHPSCGVARPLDCLEDGPALVMEAIGGASLQKLFPRWYWRAEDVKRAESACRLAGEWLRVFHKISPTSPVVSVDIENKLAEFQRAWEELGRLGFSKRAGAKIYSLLAAGANDLAAQSFAQVRIHGDFSIDNVWLDGDRAVALDISGAHRNVPELDISAFLNSLLLLRLGGWIPWHAFRSLRAAFLAGCGYDGTSRLAAVGFFQATGIVDALLEVCRRRSRWVSRAVSQPVLAGVIEVLLEHERTAQPA